MFVSCDCCVLSRRGLCDGLIIRLEESYRLWRVAVCDQVTSYARRLKPGKVGCKIHIHYGLCSARKKNVKSYLMTCLTQAMQEYKFYVDLMRRRDHWENKA